MATKLVRDTDKGLARIKREIEAAKHVTVVVGIQEGTDNPDSAVSVAQYGAYNEYGTKTIPERSFMRTSFDENVDGLLRVMARQYDQVKLGRKTTREGLGFLGQLHESQIKGKIRSIRTPPNAKETIRRKKSAKPLINHGVMVNSIRYIYRAK